MLGTKGGGKRLRKMWFWALLYFLPMLITAVFASLFPSSLITVAPAYLLYLLLIFVLFPMYANAIYYRRLRRKIQGVLGLVDDRDQRIRLIASGCGTSVIAALVVSVVLLAPLIAVVENAIIVAFGSYQDRLIKEKVHKRLLLGERYKASVQAYFVQNRKWPESTADLDDSTPNASAHAEQIETKGDGELIIYFTDIEGGSGGSISLLPTVRRGRYIEWTCSGKGMEREHLPVRCRD